MRVRRASVIRAAIAPVPAIRTRPDGDGVPAAKAVTTSPAKRLGQRRPRPAHIRAKASAISEEDTALVPASPRTPPATRDGSWVDRAAPIAAPTAVAAAGPQEIGLPGPAVPRPTIWPARVATTAREAVPPASTPMTRSMVRIET